jgi:hypothetical protein
MHTYVTSETQTSLIGFTVLCQSLQTTSVRAHTHLHTTPNKKWLHHHKFVMHVKTSRTQIWHHSCRSRSRCVEHLIHSTTNSTINTSSQPPTQPPQQRSQPSPFPLCNTAQFRRQWYNVVIPAYLLVLVLGFKERKAKPIRIPKWQRTNVYTFTFQPVHH